MSRGSVSEDVRFAAFFRTTSAVEVASFTPVSSPGDVRKLGLGLRVVRLVSKRLLDTVLVLR